MWYIASKRRFFVIEIFVIYKKLAASSMLHEAKIAYYAFDVIVYCMYTHQTRIAYTKRTH